jgi:hypothetical protein
VFRFECVLVWMHLSSITENHETSTIIENKKENSVIERRLNVQMRDYTIPILHLSRPLVIPILQLFTAITLFQPLTPFLGGSGRNWNTIYHVHLYILILHFLPVVNVLVFLPFSVGGGVGIGSGNPQGYHVHECA